MQTVGLIWIAVMSIWTFVAMGYDKQQAKKRLMRIPEKNLWLLAVLGGGIGAYFGMQVFQHKTRRTTFRIGFLMLALVYAVIVLYLFGVTMPTITAI